MFDHHQTTIVRNTFRIPISILESTSYMLQWNVTRFIRNIFAHRPWLGRRRPGRCRRRPSRFSFPSSSSKNRTQSRKSFRFPVFGVIRPKLNSGCYIKFWPRMSVKLKLVWQKPGRNLSAALRPGERRINFAEFIRRSRRINLSAKFLRY